MIRRFFIAAGAVCLMFSPARAFDAFLQIKNSGDPVPTDAVYSWVDILGFSQGAEAVAEDGREGAHLGPRVCTLQIAQDRSIANLMDSIVMGTPRDLTIQVARMSSEHVTVAYEIQFKGCLLRKVAATMEDGASQPFFNVEFAYSEMLWTVTYPDSKGNKYLATGSGYDAIERKLIDRGTISPPEPGAYAGGDPGTEPDGDLDDDGLPDTWETANGLNPNSAADATGDLDKDGFSNRDEYIAGTDPRSGGSFFRAAASGSGGQLVLTWNSVPGKTYTILATQDLSQPFQSIGTVTGAAGSQSSYTTTTSAGRFFKLSVGE